MLLMCIGFHLFFSYMMDSSGNNNNNNKKKKNKDGKADDKCKIGYRSGMQSGATLLEEFKKHPCCIRNCVVSKLGLSSPSAGYCSKCFTTSGYCGMITSCKPHVSESVQQVEFLQLVTANRSAYDEYRILEDDSAAVKSDKRKNCKSYDVFFTTKSVLSCMFRVLHVLVVYHT